MGAAASLAGSASWVRGTRCRMLFNRCGHCRPWLCVLCLKLLLLLLLACDLLLQKVQALPVLALLLVLFLLLLLPWGASCKPRRHAQGCGRARLAVLVCGRC